MVFNNNRKFNPLICCGHGPGGAGSSGGQANDGGAGPGGMGAGSGGSMGDGNTSNNDRNSASVAASINAAQAARDKAAKKAAKKAAEEKARINKITRNLFSFGLSLFSGNVVSSVTTGASLAKSLYDHAKAKGMTTAQAKSVSNSVAAEITTARNKGDLDGLTDANREQYASKLFNTAIKSGGTGVASSSGIPSNIKAGLDDYVSRSDLATNDYQQRADSLWADYLDFEKVYFDEFQGVQDEFKSNIAGIPELNLKLPDTIGGATLPMAPKVHSAMFSDRANTQGNLINTKANAQLAGLSSRDALNKNMFTVGQTGASNSLLPTQTALDLYKQERAGELGLQQVYANKPDELSTLEKWAPTVGTLLTANDSGKTNLESAWNFISDLW